MAIISLHVHAYWITPHYLVTATYEGGYRRFREVSCPAQSSGLTISHKEYNFNRDSNATLLLTLDQFETPFVFQVLNTVFVLCYIL